MSSITLDHLGYEITFCEDPEEWRCRALDMRAKTLKALKAKISKLDADSRKVSVPCAFFDYPTDITPKRGQIVLIAKENDAEIETVRLAAFQTERRRVPTVWIMSSRKGSNQQERRKFRVSNLIDITDPAAKDLLDDLREIGEQQKALKTREAKVRESIPRMTLDQIKAYGLVEDQDDG